MKNSTELLQILRRTRTPRAHSSIHHHEDGMTGKRLSFAWGKIIAPAPRDDGRVSSYPRIEYASVEFLEIWYE